MKLEQQVCSLELAKKLKGLGVKQESLFYWESTKEQPDQSVWRIIPVTMCQFSDSWLEYYSAFTVAELGEILPTEIKRQTESRREQLTVEKYENDWRVYYAAEIAQRGPDVFADTEADARAKMLCYLLENKLISV